MTERMLHSIIVNQQQKRSTHERVKGGKGGYAPLALVHDMEGLVDLVERERVGDIFIDLELALKVLHE